MKVYLIGSGPGSPSLLTRLASEKITQADMVITTPRLAAKLGSLNPRTVCKPLGEIADTILSAHEQCNTVVVLVSGDSCFFSLTKSLRPRLLAAQNIEVECLNGISSLQYLCAKTGLSYEDAQVISAHGRTNSIIPSVCYNPFVFALTGGEIKAHTLIKQLVDSGLDEVTVTVGENLSSPEEKIVSGPACALLDHTFDDLAVVAVQNPKHANKHEQIRDADFIRGAAPMTKQAIRTLGINALNIQPLDRVLDIGAGTGAVTIEMARKAYMSFVYALERHDKAIELLHQNRKRFGAFNVEILHATAPEGLDQLPSVDKAFIGGSGGALPETIKTLVSMNPQIDMVVTAITLETLHTAVSSLSSHGFSPEVMCINAAIAERTGKYHMMKAENPVYIIKGSANGS